MKVEGIRCGTQTWKGLMEQINVIGVLLNDVAREESDQVSVLDDVSKFPSFKPRIDGHAHRLR